MLSEPNNVLKTPAPFRTPGEIDSDKDGVDYINIYSQGDTELGRKLSHFAHSPFIHPYLGPFKSIEGFWFYMKSTKKDDKLRYLYGYQAKVYGRDLVKKNGSTFPQDAAQFTMFMEDILAANYQKIIQSKDLALMMADSVLPFTHFYLFEPRGDVAKGLSEEVKNRKNHVVIFPREIDWLVDGFENIRTALKAGQIPACWERAKLRYCSQITDAN